MKTPLRIARVRTPEKQTKLAVITEDETVLLSERRYATANGYLKLLKEAASSKTSVDDHLEKMVKRDRKARRLGKPIIDSEPLAGYTFLLPYSPPEVWGAGVTYLRSRDARELETSAKGIYERVYEAERPEIFFKATASRCVGPFETAYIRSDTRWAVPEPELAVVVGYDGEVVGYMIGNDLSARDIEGENPLYLPQAKIYRGSCVLGPVVATPQTIPDPKNLVIEMKIFRDGKQFFTGSVHTSRIKREIKELVYYLTKDNVIPPGTVLLTGTGIVPPDDFSLRTGDVVEIRIEKIGVVRNPIVQLSSQGKPS